jgi:Cu2+-exporting ATPase
MTARACFHCALPVDPDNEFQVEIDGELKSVCCPGCKAVAELIRDTGMSSYYAMREAPQPGVGRPPSDTIEWRVFDREDMLTAFAELGDDVAEATIYVGKMYCAACSWLIESTLAAQRGVDSADVNPVTHRLRVRWQRADTRLSQILGSLASLGYDPQPLAPESTARPEVAEQRTALKRLLVASLGMMQAMMFAIGLYAGDFQGIEPDMQLFLRLVSFVVTTPVVFYSARPFFAGAWRGIRRRRPGMDLPVSIAVGTAYVASIYATLTQGEAVIPAGQLVAGDRVRILAGESIPADGILTDGRTSVDEALLTGEARPQLRVPGDSLVAGSINLDGIIEMRVEKTGPDTTLGTINRLSERARFARPEFVQLADRIASYIVVAILGIATIVATWWYFHAPDQAFVVTLSVLVVTCPCALALATPAAFAAAGTRLAELRLLVTNGNAIEALSKATKIVFDKTGTLTQGTPVIVATTVLDPAYDEHECLQFAAALESASTHPVAAAFEMDQVRVVASDHRVAVGEGVAGTIDGRRWRLGREEFAVAPSVGAASVGAASSRDRKPPHSVFLGVDDQLVAAFDVKDEVRPDARDVLQEISDSGLALALASGDNEHTVRRVARTLSIEDYHSGCKPEDKLAIIHAAQQQGDTVIMVGDGINDAPVLAGADASVAMAEGALLAQTSADVIMLGHSLAPLVTALRTAKQTMRIVRQNLGWAIVYNATALPLAAMGWVPPWAAAIGMSASSLIVVLNALRLSRFGET